MIGRRVSDQVINRSGLLSGIQNTTGVASLPSHLSPEDVQLWQTACAVDVDMSMDELIKVVKVCSPCCPVLLVKTPGLHDHPKKTS